MHKLRAVFKRLRHADHRHYISILIIVALVAWSVFFCGNSYIRLGESIRDFFYSFLDALFYDYSWCPDVTVDQISSVDVVSYIPQSWIDFGINFDLFIALFFDPYNLLGYLLWILPVINTINQLVMILGLFALIFFVIKKFVKPEVTTNTGFESKPLVFYKKVKQAVIEPLKTYVYSLVSFLLNNSFYKNVIIIIFLFSTNLISIVVSFFAFYFYFCGTLNVFNIPVQLYKLSVDLIIGFDTLPFAVWLIIGWFVFDYFTRKHGYKILLVKEKLNKAVVKLLGLITLIIAPMRGGKTKLQSSMNVTKAQVLREDMLDNMLQVHSHFPHFPFERFIAHLNDFISKGKLKSFRLCELHVAALKKTFDDAPSSSNLFEYYYSLYPMRYDNGLVVIDLFEDLCVFVKSYTVYTQPTLFIGNYSIRELHVLTTKGNFPLWDFDLFKKPSFDGRGTFGRKLNFDIIRPGKKLGEDKDIYGLLEYGLLAIQEADKEFGNKTETEEMKRNSLATNMKNDFHNKFFKTMGHAGMVNYKSTLSSTMDSQRKGSLGADTHELGLICKIRDESEVKLAVPFFIYRDMIYRLAKRQHAKYKASGWYYRADCTLFHYFIDSVLTSIMRYGEKIYNIFGYTELELELSDGSDEGDKQLVTWYALNKKDKGGLYATDALREMFRRHNARSGKGFSDLLPFDTLHPSLDELKTDLNSFMINDFTKENKDDVK